MRTITPAIGTRPYFNQPGIEASVRLTVIKAKTRPGIEAIPAQGGVTS